MLRPHGPIDPEGALFVYGSLLSGGGTGFLAGLQARPGRVRGRLFRMPHGYPALVLEDEGGWVAGELVLLDGPHRLAVLDHYEGVGRGLYTRVAVRVASAGRARGAWAYTMTEAQVRSRRGVSIPSGRWRTAHNPGA